MRLNVQIGEQDIQQASKQKLVCNIQNFVVPKSHTQLDARAKQAKAAKEAPKPPPHKTQAARRKVNEATAGQVR